MLKKDEDDQDRLFFAIRNVWSLAPDDVRKCAAFLRDTLHPSHGDDFDYMMLRLRELYPDTFDAKDLRAIFDRAGVDMRTSRDRAEDNALERQAEASMRAAKDAMNRESAALAATTGLAIRASVGANAENRPSDVRRVAQRLQELGCLDAPTGDAADPTDLIDAITDYQSRILGSRRPDGRVDPGGLTLRALSARRTAISMRL